MRKKTLKRILAAMLALMLCFTLLPSGSSYAEDVENQQIASDGEDETLEVEAATEDVVEEADPQDDTEEITEDNTVEPVTDIEIQEEEPEVTDEEAAATEDVMLEEETEELPLVGTSSVPGSGTYVKNITIYVNQDERCTYGDYLTHPMSTSGTATYANTNVYCIDPSFATPSSGTSCKAYEITNANLRRLMYFSKGAPGYLANQAWCDATLGNALGSPNGETGDKNRLIATHLSLSKAAEEAGYMKSSRGWDYKIDAWWVSAVNNYYNAMLQQTTLYSPTIPDTFHVYYLVDGANMNQGLLTWYAEPEGAVSLKKVSGNTSVTNNNSFYSLAGAKYTVTNSAGTVVGTLTTTADGSTNTISGLDYGTYMIKETKASTGYGLDETVYSVTLSASKKSATVTSTEPAKVGSIKLKKVSGNTAMTNNNSCYSLKGATYEVKNSSGTVVGTLTTDANGDSNTLTNLPLGTYTIKETKASTGFGLDTTTYTKTITANNCSTVQVVTSTEPALNDPAAIVINKVDADGNKVSGGASLAGAQFTIKYYAGYYDFVSALPSSATRTWVIQTKEESGIYRTGLFEKYKVSGDEFYLGKTGQPILPLGTITIQETKAPTGYNNDGVLTDRNGNQAEGIYLTQIKDSTSGVILVGGNTYTVADSVKRFDLSFTKLDYETRLPMAGVAFKITSKTTGESHIVVTDENGFFSTAADYKKHSENTNGNDSLKDYSKATSVGVWFSSTNDAAVDDTLGALPYDTYIIDELRCKANEGKQLITGVEVKPAERGTKNVGILNNTPNPSIGTTAKSVETQSKEVLAKEGAEIIDTVDYKYLTAGATYTLKATLMDKETESPLLINGEQVTGEKTFTVDGNFTVTETEKTGSVDVSLKFDASDLGGKTLVVYEKLYNEAGELVASHEDISDEGQTLIIPGIGTTALDSGTGINVSEAKSEVSINDEVAYVNLIAGQKYTVKGVLMDKTTGEELLINGKTVTAEKTFTAEGTDGSVVLSFTFDASELKNKSVVVFERVYSGDIEIATHTVITDEGQTIHIPVIGTTAEETGTGDKLIKASDTASITDIVTFQNLVPGKEYTVSGVLMDKDTGEKILDADGNEVTATKTFTPDKADGSVEIVFEFDGSLLAGTTIVAFEDVDYKGREVAIHADITDEAQTVYVPEIHTTAINEETGDHLALPEESVTIVDTVSYSNLIPDQEYTVSGILMDQATGEELLDANGNAVTSEATFTPEESEGTVDVTFTFDASLMKGVSTVVFETLYFGEKEIAVHTDLSDEDQTIHFPEIGTTAVDSETGINVSYPAEETTIIDTVIYKNLIPGKEYTVSGVLMDKSTGEPLLVDGEQIVAEKTFVPEEANGSVDLTYTLDSSLLAGTTVVVFENVKDLGKDVAFHADIEDEDQSVHFPKVSTTAVDSDTEDHISEADEDITLVDTVAYTNLVPGYEYTVTGVLMDKADAGFMKDDNEDLIIASTTFTPEEADGTVDVTFTFAGSTLKGKTTVVFESLTYNEKEVATHADITDEGQTVKFTEIHTNATNEETGTHTAYPSATVTIVDAVTYNNLIVGKEYTISGTLMNKKTGEPILDNGLEVTAEKTFVAEQESDTENLTFTFNASALAGESIVAFEIVTYKGKEVAAHTDLTDEDQTVHFPKVGTTAKFSTGTKITKKFGKITIVDTVAYQNLVPGETYIIRGTLMDKTTGEVFQIDGVEIAVVKEFTPETESGSVDVTFTFDAEKFPNHDLVVFEEIYTKDTNTLVAEHKDINDIGQTVSLDDVPKTGDSFPVIPICAAAFLALIGLVAVIRKKKIS